MRILLIFVTVLALVTALAAQSTPAKPTIHKGVVDEQGEDFVLATAGNFEAVAVLYSPNFDKQIFARFVGHPVEAKGTLITKEGKKVLQIQSIDDIKRLPEPGDTKKE